MLGQPLSAALHHRLPGLAPHTGQLCCLWAKAGPSASKSHVCDAAVVKLLGCYSQAQVYSISSPAAHLASLIHMQQSSCSCQEDC